MNFDVQNFKFNFFSFKGNWFCIKIQQILFPKISTQRGVLLFGKPSFKKAYASKNEFLVSICEQKFIRFFIIHICIDFENQFKIHFSFSEFVFPNFL